MLGNIGTLAELSLESNEEIPFGYISYPDIKAFEKPPVSQAACKLGNLRMR